MSKYSTRHGPFTFKRVAGVAYQADLALPDETKWGVVAGLSQAIMRSAAGKPSKGNEDHSLPLLVFFHGGGLVAGSRTEWPPHWLSNSALDAGFAILSVDYTLLSPATGHAQVQDVTDLFKWIATDLNQIISNSAAGSGQLINPDRIVTAGTSAGGYLSYLSGIYATPKPKAVLSVYGMGGDYLLDHWVLQKTETFLKMGGNVLPLLPSITPYLPLVNASPSSPPVVQTSRDYVKEPRLSYLSLLLQTGTFLDVLTGHKGLGEKLSKLEKKDRAAAVPADARALFPDLLLDTNFPPTFLIHGTSDSIVPFDESRNMLAVLKRLGVEAELLEIHGVNHAFDILPGYEGHAELERGVLFLSKHAS